MVLSMLLRPAAAARPTAVVWRRAASWPTSAALLGRRSPVQLAGGSWRRGVASKAGEEDQWALGKAAFKGLYPQIIADINDDVAATGMPPSACAWVERMVNYTLPGGKLNRGTMVHLMYNEILSARGDSLSGPTYEAYLERAHVAGWCIELVQGAFLVADDMMDASVTRRGGPCWYKLPEVQTIAINDAFLLLSFTFRLLLKYCKDIPEYTHLLNLFNEVIWMTELGQLLDTTGVAETVDDTLKFDMPYYQKIVHCKTADYTFYLPVACAMSLAGETSPEAYAEARQVCHAIGEYFQIQDDYLDCYGDPEVTGKVGTDIEDRCVQNARRPLILRLQPMPEEPRMTDVCGLLFVERSKCTWLMCTALEKADEATAASLRAAYVAANATTSEGAAAVAKVRQIYGELAIERAYLVRVPLTARLLAHSARQNDLHALDRDCVCVQEYEAAQLQELGNLLKGLRYAPPVAFELVLGKLAGRSK